MQLAITEQEKRAGVRRGLLLENITLGWNVVGSVIVILAAVAARSVALAGFGLDSLIEIFASLIVVWELTGRGAKNGSAQRCGSLGLPFSTSHSISSCSRWSSS